MEIRTNYQLILIKCLREEIKAFLTYTNDKETKKNRVLAFNWIFNDDYNPENEFSCQRICKALHKDINVLRKNVAFARNQRWNLDEYMNYSLYGKDPKEKEDAKNGHEETEASDQGTEEEPTS